MYIISFADNEKYFLGDEVLCPSIDSLLWLVNLLEEAEQYYYVSSSFGVVDPEDVLGSSYHNGYPNWLTKENHDFILSKNIKGE